MNDEIIKRCCISSRFSRILRTFFGISNLTEKLNDAVGSIFTGICFAILPLYTAKLESIAEKGLWSFNTADCIMHAIFIPAILLTAASAHSQVVVTNATSKMFPFIQNYWYEI